MISREEKVSSPTPVEFYEVAGGPVALGQVAVILLQGFVDISIVLVWKSFELYTRNIHKNFCLF